MQKIKPINIENHKFMIHPLRQQDMSRISQIENELFEILHDNESTKYIEGGRLPNRNAISDRMFGIIMGYQTGQSYSHFITDKRTMSVIGMVDIISPARAREIYTLDKYNWMITYFLHKEFWGQGIIPGVVNAICQNIKSQGINTIAAICDRENIRSIRVLEKVGFHKTMSFDIKQDYFEI
jgi:RimJ/RimL family protein N-acetyltransferase